MADNVLIFASALLGATLYINMLLATTEARDAAFASLEQLARSISNDRFAELISGEPTITMPDIGLRALYIDVMNLDDGHPEFSRYAAELYNRIRGVVGYTPDGDDNVDVSLFDSDAKMMNMDADGLMIFLLNRLRASHIADFEKKLDTYQQSLMLQSSSVPSTRESRVGDLTKSIRPFDKSNNQNTSQDIDINPVDDKTSPRPK